jgi:hypothetical protein
MRQAKVRRRRHDLWRKITRPSHWVYFLSRIDLDCTDFQFKVNENQAAVLTSSRESLPAGRQGSRRGGESDLSFEINIAQKIRRAENSWLFQFFV